MNLSLQEPEGPGQLFGVQPEPLLHSHDLEVVQFRVGGLKGLACTAMRGVGRREVLQAIPANKSDGGG